LRIALDAVHCWIGVAHGQGRRTVRLAGALSEEEVPDLLETCGDLSAVTLDLTDLVDADDVALDALRRIRLGGATLVGVPEYMQRKLGASGWRCRGQLPLTE
jgi:hypothetical protein